MAIRDSIPITLLSQQLITQSAFAGPVITNLKGLVDLLAYFTVSAVPTGGTPILDVYLQTSADGGTTWQDIAHLQWTTSASTQYIQLAGESVGQQNIVASQSVQLPAGQVIQGPWGDQLRLWIVFTAGGSSGFYQLRANGYLK